MQKVNVIYSVVKSSNTKLCFIRIYLQASHRIQIGLKFSKKLGPNQASPNLSQNQPENLGPIYSSAWSYPKIIHTVFFKLLKILVFNLQILK